MTFVKRVERVALAVENLEQARTYFEKCFERFSENTKLGIGGGDIYNKVGDSFELEKMPHFHVRGATKIYKKECWKDIGRLKGPILRGLSSRAPYFHNGSAKTLMDVINFYDARFNMNLTAQQKADLVAFLRACK